MAPNAAPNNEILSVKGLSVFYGQIRAIEDVSLSVNQGELVVLIGANGAGKSTLFKSILGIQPAATGAIHFQGKEITRQPPEKIVAAGISIVPEGRGVLAGMTVLENLLLGAYHLKNDPKANLEHQFERFPVLAERQHEMAGKLSGGQQQMLAIARALMGKPQLLLLDEPSLGLAPIIVDQVYDIMMGLKKENLTILLSEQMARKGLQCADRGYVLDLGRSIICGSARELINNPEVQEAYLGCSE